MTQQNSVDLYTLFFISGASKYAALVTPAKDPDHECHMIAGGVTTNCVTGRIDFQMTGRPDFDADHRLKRCNFVLPKAGVTIPGIVSSTRVSCTYRGGQCTACRLPSSTHRINDKPVILFLTDEFGPAMFGGDNDCCPTIRINGGSFEQFKRVIEWQEKEGQIISYGSVAILSIVTHLCRVGHDFFWTELRAFSEWCKIKNLLLMPMIPFFPTTISEYHKIEIHKAYTHTQLLHYGNNVAGREQRFCLWEPVVKTALDIKNVMVSVEPPVFRVAELGDPILGTVGHGGDSFIGGFSNMDNSVSSKVERTFMLHTAELLQKVMPLVIPSSVHPSIPSDKSVNQTIQRDVSEHSEHEGKTIYLIGNSILGACEESLTEMAGPLGVEVISLCKSGSYKKVFLNERVNLEEEWQAITEGEASDIAVICVAGNEMVHKKSFYNNSSTCHISNPKILTNEQAALLIQDVQKIIQIVRTNFKGKVFVFGPTPRHIEKCCNQVRHAILDVEGKQVDMVKYTDGVTEFMSKTLSLPVNTEFVGYKEQIGGEFVGEMLVDGVHLEKSTQVNLSGFVLGLLDRQATGAVPVMANCPPFLNVLVGNGVKALGDVEME